MRNLLLVSTSTVQGTGYLDHCAEAIRDVFGGLKRILFVPYALHDRDAYADEVGERFARFDLRVDAIHSFDDPRAAVADAQGIFIGGGNTFRLLKTLYDESLIGVIRKKALAGMPYLGTSAGSNVACATMMTTNDMPIVYPPSFEALALVPFQINPHYLDPPPGSTHMGETRETRIKEFHEENEAAVLGLREGAMLRVRDVKMTLEGQRGARLLRRGMEPEELEPGARLDSLLKEA